jgi:hypothetical protein
MNSLKGSTDEFKHKRNVVFTRVNTAIYDVIKSRPTRCNK